MLTLGQMVPLECTYIAEGTEASNPSTAWSMLQIDGCICFYLNSNHARKVFLSSIFIAPEQWALPQGKVIHVEYRHCFFFPFNPDPSDASTVFSLLFKKCYLGTEWEFTQICMIRYLTILVSEVRLIILSVVPMLWQKCGHLHSIICLVITVEQRRNWTGCFFYRGIHRKC